MLLRHVVHNYEAFWCAITCGRLLLLHGAKTWNRSSCDQAEVPAHEQLWLPDRSLAVRFAARAVSERCMCARITTLTCMSLARPIGSGIQKHRRPPAVLAELSLSFKFAYISRVAKVSVQRVDDTAFSNRPA